MLRVHLNATYFFTFHASQHQIWYVRKYVTLTYEDVILAFLSWSRWKKFSTWKISAGEVEVGWHMVGKMARCWRRLIFVAWCTLKEWRMGTGWDSRVKLGVFTPAASGGCGWWNSQLPSWPTYVCMATFLPACACCLSREYWGTRATCTRF